MIRISALIAISLLTATVVLGQQEFGRSSGGEIEATMKRPNMLSGSIGIGLSGSKSYFGTFGGTVVPDRLWFFGSTELSQGTRFAPAAVSSPAPVIALGKMTAQITDQKSVTAFALPSSFLSLHYTGIVSSNAFFTATVTRQSATQLAP